MKRLLILLLILLQLVSLLGCDRQTEGKTPTDTMETSETETVTEDTQQSTEDTTETDTSEPAPPEPAAEEFVLIADYIPSAKLEIAYATEDNFTGQKIYDFSETYLRYGTVKKLKQVSDELEKFGVGLIIWDAFRPISAQAKLWEIRPNARYVSNPVTGKRTHSRGNTVDVTLYDLTTGELMSMPTGYDNFTKLADRDYSDCDVTAAANALLLEQIMEQCGFTPYEQEWWHFTDTVDYPVDEQFDPGVLLWTPNCDEYISLRDGNGNTIAEIPNGAALQLKSWSGKLAKVSYEGTEGYVWSNYIMPYDEEFLAKSLDTVVPTNTYTYSQMVADMAALCEKYPSLVTVSSIGTSELGVDIPVMLLGDPNAPYQVLLQGAVHGREHMTAWLLMAMADYWLDNSLFSYGKVCYHIIPMVNPDGVAISQNRTLNDAQREIYLSDLAYDFTTQSESDYAYNWKANGLGVDINRNFPSGWETINNRLLPSSEGFQGLQPFSTAEAAALRDYTLLYPFKATVNYHAFGSIIYYQYGSKEPVNSQSSSLAGAVKRTTGYPLVGGSGVAAAGYKDWAMDELGIPSVTVEIGVTAAPLAYRELHSVFARNIGALPAVAMWLQRQ